ncbi:MAG TPA: S24/S26 family peptidase [Ktedonobacteraceae bacterium]|jgi:hypothetical protein|nr:S24/S26 family peptidase [Ktedonobacteraceae bacterium]
MPEISETRARVIDSLYIEAIRQGQPTWFRVASGSMRPLIHMGDSVYIEPAQAISVGDIAAFETPEGLVIHRIVRRQTGAAGTRYLEMGDMQFSANWFDEQAVVGRVTLVRSGTTQIDLRLSIAKRYGKLSAQLRYRLYCLHTHLPLLRVVVRKCATLVARLAYLRMRPAAIPLNE